MSSYRVTGDGPTIASQHGDAVEKRVQNKGASVCYLSETPGIATLGLELAPGASYTWPVRTPLYIQCLPGSTNYTTVSVGENSGDLFTPGTLNTPGQLFSSQGALCASDVQTPPVTPTASSGTPRGGQGDTWLQFKQFGGPFYATTPVMDVRNYNSIVLTAAENGLGGSTYEYREVFLVWSELTSLGQYVTVYRENAKYLTRSIISAQVIEAYTQLHMHLPVRGSYLQVYVTPVTYAAETSEVNTLDFTVFGDNRTLAKPIVKNASWYWWNNENTATPFFDTDLSFTSDGSVGSISVPAAGQVSYSFSSISGPCMFSVRMNTTAASVQNTRVEILDRATPLRQIAGTDFVAGITGVQRMNTIVYLPRSPCTLLITNAQAAATTFVVALIPELK